MSDADRVRLSLDVPPDLLRRIASAAAERNLNVAAILDRSAPGGGRLMTEANPERSDRVREEIKAGQRPEYAFASRG